MKRKTAKGQFRKDVDGLTVFDLDENAADLVRAEAARRRITEAGVVIISLAAVLENDGGRGFGQANVLMEELAESIADATFEGGPADLAHAVRYYAQFATTERVPAFGWSPEEDGAIETEEGKR